MNKQRESVSVTIHKLISYEDGPIATVRYTEYALDNKVHSVDQIDYYDITEMNNQILTAVILWNSSIQRSLLINQK